MGSWDSVTRGARPRPVMLIGVRGCGFRARWGWRRRRGNLQPGGGALRAWANCHEISAVMRLLGSLFRRWFRNDSRVRPVVIFRGPHRCQRRDEMSFWPDITHGRRRLFFASQKLESDFAPTWSVAHGCVVARLKRLNCASHTG